MGIAVPGNKRGKAGQAATGSSSRLCELAVGP